MWKLVSFDLSLFSFDFSLWNYSDWNVIVFITCILNNERIHRMDAKGWAKKWYELKHNSSSSSGTNVNSSDKRNTRKCCEKGNHSASASTKLKQKDSNIHTKHNVYLILLASLVSIFIPALFSSSLFLPVSSLVRLDSVLFCSVWFGSIQRKKKKTISAATDSHSNCIRFLHLL